MFLPFDGEIKMYTLVIKLDVRKISTGLITQHPGQRVWVGYQK